MAGSVCLDVDDRLYFLLVDLHFFLDGSIMVVYDVIGVGLPNEGQGHVEVVLLHGWTLTVQKSFVYIDAWLETFVRVILFWEEVLCDGLDDLWPLLEGFREGLFEGLGAEWSNLLAPELCEVEGRICHLIIANLKEMEII